eukprot:358859-Chlamydomonas_euryale.AAC.8
MSNPNHAGCPTLSLFTCCLAERLRASTSGQHASTCACTWACKGCGRIHRGLGCGDAEVWGCKPGAGGVASMAQARLQARRGYQHGTGRVRIAAGLQAWRRRRCKHGRGCQHVAGRVRRMRSTCACRQHAKAFVTAAARYPLVVVVGVDLEPVDRLQQLRLFPPRLQLVVQDLEVGGGAGAQAALNLPCAVRLGRRRRLGLLGSEERLALVAPLAQVLRAPAAKATAQVALQHACCGRHDREPLLARLVAARHLLDVPARVDDDAGPLHLRRRLAHRLPGDRLGLDRLCRAFQLGLRAGVLWRARRLCDCVVVRCAGAFVAEAAEVRLWRELAGVEQDGHHFVRQTRALVDLHVDFAQRFVVVFRQLGRCWHICVGGMRHGLGRRNVCLGHRQRRRHWRHATRGKPHGAAGACTHGSGAAGPPTATPAAAASLRLRLPWLLRCWRRCAAAASPRGRAGAAAAPRLQRLHLVARQVITLSACGPLAAVAGVGCSHGYACRFRRRRPRGWLCTRRPCGRRAGACT